MLDKEYQEWMRAGIEAWSLGMAASAVVGLRMARLAAGGDAAAREAELMIAEKVQAGLELQAEFLTTSLGATPVAATRKAMRHMRRKVDANRKRLSR